MIARCLQIAPFKSFHIVWLGGKNVFAVPPSLPTTFLVWVYGPYCSADLNYTVPPSQKREGGEIQECSNGREKD